MPLPRVTSISGKGVTLTREQPASRRDVGSLRLSQHFWGPGSLSALLTVRRAWMPGQGGDRGDETESVLISERRQPAPPTGGISRQTGCVCSK